MRESEELKQQRAEGEKYLEALIEYFGGSCFEKLSDNNLQGNKVTMNIPAKVKQQITINQRHYIPIRLVNYKGLSVVRNFDKLNGTKYYTVVNEENGSHIHIAGKNMAYRVCDCYDDFVKDRDISKCEKYYRKGALGLAGYNIKPKKD